MIGLVQRVSEASVTVDGACKGSIERGILLFLAVQPADSERNIERMAERVLTYRVFSDQDGKMNESLLDQGLALLVVPQFTLAADTKKGTRASFTTAAPTAPRAGLVSGCYPLDEYYKSRPERVQLARRKREAKARMKRPSS